MCILPVLITLLTSLLTGPRCQTMATSEKVCEICKLSRDPAILCSGCDEELCIHCSEHHALSNCSGQDITIPVEQYKTLPPFIRNIKQFCNKHNEKLQSFCKIHDCPCCRKCIIENHEKCADVVKLKDVIGYAKTSPNNKDLMKQLIEMADNIKQIQKNKRDNPILLSKQRKIIEKQIDEARKKINAHLDRMQEKLITELTEAEGKANSQIQTMITELQRRENEINEFKVGLENITKHASDLQAFLGIKQIESTAMATEKYLQSLVEDGRAYQTNLVCKINVGLEKLMYGHQIFGEIIIESKKSDVAINIVKLKQAQIPVVIPPKSVDNVTPKLNRRINHGTKHVWGCCFLPNGSMVFSSEYDKCISVLNKDCSMKFTIDLKPGYPRGVACIDDNTLAVAVDNGVRIINIDNRSIDRTLRDLRDVVCGIAYTDGKLLCCVEGKGILSINIQNDTVTTVVRFQSPFATWVTSNGDNIYYTDCENHTVTCCDMTGTTRWRFNNTRIMKEPHGITVDRNGFIYVAAHTKTLVISPDGLQYKELIPSPTTIHCDKSTNTLLAADFDETAKLYNI